MYSSGAKYSGCYKDRVCTQKRFPFSDDSITRADVTWRHREGKVATLKRLPKGLEV